MNHVFWNSELIGVFTNQFDSKNHSHLMMQFFIAMDEEPLTVIIDNVEIKSNCVLVNSDTTHAFSSNNTWHFSLLIDPLSVTGILLRQSLAGVRYGIYPSKSYIFDPNTMSEKNYQDFIHNLLDPIIKSRDCPLIDSRIGGLLDMLSNCICDTHELNAYAQSVSLSQSRLSHLFKQEMGLSLKSYILLHQTKIAFMRILEGQSITASALEVGFDSSAHFAATAQRLMGISASQSTKDSRFLKVKPL